MNRTFGLIIGVCWLALMGRLFQQDVLPIWTAQDAPLQTIPDSNTQVGIFDAGRRRIGTSWITTLAAERTVQSTTFLRPGSILETMLGLGELMLDSNLTYGPDGGVDQFRFSIHAGPAAIQIAGERYGSDFACTAQFGNMPPQSLDLDARVSHAIGESLRPFTHLKNLRVGQSWRIRLVDPFALMKDQSVDFRPQLVRVTKREVIRHHGREVECFRVETEGSTAWADDRGRILRQEVDIPILGKWTLVDEPFDAKSRAAARSSRN